MVQIDKSESLKGFFLDLKKKLDDNKAKGCWMYGIGKTADILYELIAECGIKLDGCVVDDEYYRQADYKNVPVMKWSEWSDRIVSSVQGGGYIILAIHSRSIVDKVIERLSHNVVPIYKVLHLEAYKSATWLDYEYYNANRKVFENAYNKLADSESRQVMDAFLYACATGDDKRWLATPLHRQYFNELTESKKIKVFVDLGAYIGDTVVDAVNYYGKDALSRIYAWECDKDVATKLRRTLQDNNLEDAVTVIEKGAWSQSATLCFSPDGNTGGRIVEAGIEIQVDAVDNIVGSGRVDFIKADIEGAELEALKGATNTIKAYLPTLAFCAYHKKEDLITLVDFINSICPKKYDFYLRRHLDDLWEMVLYAVPKKL